MGPEMELLDAKQAGQMLKCSDKHVRRLTKSGDLPSIVIGKRRWWRRGSLAEWILSKESKQPRTITGQTVGDGQ